MKKSLHRKTVNNLPTGTKIVTYICLAWALIVSLVPLIWLVLSSLKKRSDGETWVPAAGVDLFRWIYFYF